MNIICIKLTIENHAFLLVLILATTFLLSYFLGPTWCNFYGIL